MIFALVLGLSRDFDAVVLESRNYHKGRAYKRLRKKRLKEAMEGCECKNLI